MSVVPSLLLVRGIAVYANDLAPELRLGLRRVLGGRVVRQPREEGTETFERSRRLPLLITEIHGRRNRRKVGDEVGTQGMTPKEKREESFLKKRPALRMVILWQRSTPRGPSFKH